MTSRSFRRTRNFLSKNAENLERVRALSPAVPNWQLTISSEKVVSVEVAIDAVDVALTRFGDEYVHAMQSSPSIVLIGGCRL